MTRCAHGTTPAKATILALAQCAASMCFHTAIGNFARGARGPAQDTKANPSGIRARVEIGARARNRPRKAKNNDLARKGGTTEKGRAVGGGRQGRP